MKRVFCFFVYSGSDFDGVFKVLTMTEIRPKFVKIFYNLLTKGYKEVIIYKKTIHGVRALDNRKILARIEELKSEIKRLPSGYISHKIIYGRERCYYQWRENGKLKSQFIKEGEYERLMKDIEKRRKDQEELKKLQKLVPETIEGEILYSTNVMIGKELYDNAKIASEYEKRDKYYLLEKYLYGKQEDKVCVLYGLRRTGKTTLIRQAILNMSDEDREKTAYIKITADDTMAELNFDLKKLRKQNYKYVFIDEITLMKDFIDSAAILSDIYAAMGMKIVLSGTDSLGFRLAENQELYDRAYNISTTFIPFREYSRLLKKDDIDEYIRYGGTLKAGETDFDNTDDMAFYDDESARRYVDTAICRNIQHSLAHCGNGTHFRHLISLYESGELTNAINRIIEDMNHRFLVDVVVREFKSADLSNAAKNLRRERNPAKRTEILDIIDEQSVVKRMMNVLEMKNIEEQKIGITEDHITEIKQYLKELDLISECKIIQADLNISHIDYIIFTQPGMRYCQAQVLVHSLMKDSVFGLLEKPDQDIVCDKILEDVRGRMLEDIVLLETYKAIDPKRYEVFKLRFDTGEFDMVIYDHREQVCGIYEIKHSDKFDENQYRHLADEEKCALTECRFGKIVNKTVLYRGENFEADNGISYLNVEEYLNDIENLIKLEPIQEEMMTQDGMTMI